MAFGTKRPCTSQWQKAQKVHIFGQICFEKKIGSIKFFQFYMCLNIVRDIYFNMKKLGGHGSRFPRKTQNIPQNRHFCIVGYHFPEAKQCNSVNVITPCNQCAPEQKMLPTRASIDWRAISTARLERLMPKPP